MIIDQGQKIEELTEEREELQQKATKLRRNWEKLKNELKTDSNPET